MLPDQYPNYMYGKTLEIYAGYFDSLNIMILFSYPSSIGFNERLLYMYTSTECLTSFAVVDMWDGSVNHVT